MFRLALEQLGIKLDLTDKDLSALIRASYAEMVRNERLRAQSEESSVSEDKGQKSQKTPGMDGVTKLSVRRMEMGEGAVSFRVVDDPKLIAQLEASPKRLGYRNVVLNEDGTFSSPMAYWLQHPTGGAKTRVEMDKFKLGEWEEAVEHPEVVDESGKVTLVKPNKKLVESVAYDPYIHNRLDPVNLQFKEAWRRNDLVYVETEVAEIDLNSGYHADKALLSVGVQPWSNGALMLSRYDKPVRILPWEEVADAWAKRLDGKGVEFDVVPPALLPLLAERGVEILPPHKGMGKDCNEAYEEWKKENKTSISERSSAVSGNSSSNGLQNGDSAHLSHVPLAHQVDVAKLQNNSRQTIASSQKKINEGGFANISKIGTAIRDIAKVLKLDKSKSSLSYYGDFYEGDFIHDGVTLHLRLSSHPANGARIGNSNSEDKVSIVIRKNGEHTSTGAHNGYVEYVYEPEEVSLTDAANAIIKGVNNLISQGEYIDETGKAHKTEYPYIDKEGGLRFLIANNNQEVFVSNAEQAVKGIKQDKATPQQWKAMIQSKGGLKAGEDKWMGLSEWLDEKAKAAEANKSNKANVITKQEVLDFIGENKIKIEEVKYGGRYYKYLRNPDEGDYDFTYAAYEEIEYRYGDIGEFDYWPSESFEFEGDVKDRLRAALTANKNAHFVDERYYDFEDESDIDEYIREVEKSMLDDIDSWIYKKGDNDINSTRLEKTTEGLENKSEIALTVPTIESWNEGDDIHFGDAGGGRAVAWARFGETTDSEGNSVLVIDEIQSKRHQDGREQGYKENINPTDITFDEYDFYYNGEPVAHYDMDNDGNIMVYIYGHGRRKLKSDTEEEAKKTIASELPRKGIPDAPFDKNWHELAMKRMLRLAAEEGFDKVAWTTGVQQAKRYNIGDSIDSILCEDVEDSTPIAKTFILRTTSGNTVRIHADKDGMIRGGEYKDHPLSDVVGKELAAKMMQSGDFKISGEGLNVGGEGMKGFYDKMLPSFVNKYVKKWGAKVGEVELPNLEKAGQKMWSVDITPEMKESVMEGQVMFSVKGFTPEEQEIIDEAKKNGTWMLAPNGKATNLTEKQWAQVRTKAFKKWFGDWENDPENASKIVDENGEPMVVYHDTNSTIYRNVETGEIWDELDWRAKQEWDDRDDWEDYWREEDFYEFDNKHHGRRSVEMPAFFFSPNYDEYHEYGERTIAAFLNIRNPKFNPDIKDRGVTNTAGEDAMNELISQGYDGFIRTEDGEWYETNAFFPNQIKSATDNVGTFDEGDKDIRFSVKEYSERFDRELQQQIDGTLPVGHIYQLGMPSMILRSCGFPNMPIELSSTNLAEHARKTRHPFELKDVMGLVDALQKPIAVFEYGDEKKSQNVIIEIQKNDRNFLVGIHFNQSRRNVVVSDIRGIFPKDNAEWLNWITQDKHIYLDKKRIQDLINKQRKNLAEVEYLDLDSIAKVLKDFENPKLSEGNVRFRFVEAMNSDEIYEELSYLSEWSTGAHDVMSSLEEYYGGEILYASRGARYAIKEGKIPVPGRKYSGKDGEYHHFEFRREDGDTFVESVPFVDAEDAGERGIRFSFIGERGAANLDKSEEATTRLDNLSVAAIPQIIENSIYIASEKNEDTKIDTESFDYYVCGLKIGNEDYTVKSVIATLPNGARYYDHKLTTVEKGKLIDLINKLPNHVSNPISSESSTESGNYYVGKDTRLFSILQTNASKIVDENGEPMVIYHGTMRHNFTAFKNNGSGISLCVFI